MSSKPARFGYPHDEIIKSFKEHFGLEIHDPYHSLSHGYYIEPPQKLMFRFGPPTSKYVVCHYDQWAAEQRCWYVYINPGNGSKRFTTNEFLDYLATVPSAELFLEESS